MPHRYLAKKAKDFFAYRVLGVNDTPHRIALGVAVGMFIAWTPTVGVQMGLTVVVCALVGANKVVGLPWVWISNPATMLPIYYWNYRLGRLVLGGRWPPLRLGKVMKTPGWWQKFWILLEETVVVGWPLWLGSVIVAAATAVPTYFVIRWAVITYRRYRHHQPAQEQQHRTTDRT